MNDKYLFIVCPNNSGSTLIHDCIADCEKVLSMKKEGGRVVSSLPFFPHPYKLKVSRLWTEKSSEFTNKDNYAWKYIDYLWEREWKKNNHYVGDNTSYIKLEKSPPNVLRMNILQEHFPNPYFITMNRNPYAVAEGIRRKSFGISIERCIEHWIKCLEYQYKNINLKSNYIYFSYEDLCNNTKAIENKIRNFLPELDDLDLSKHNIINKNEEQIKRLSMEDINIISKYLEPIESLLNYFDYKLYTG